MPTSRRGDGRSDAALLAAHIAGDRDAFAELFIRHHAQLYRLARGHSATAEDAADAVQEAMLDALRAAGRFRRDAAVASWLHRIVVNACRDRFRYNSVRPTTALAAHGATVADHLGARSARDYIERAEQRLLVHQALLRLPVEQRAAVMFVDMHGHSVAEAAVLLGVAEGTVKSRRARARRRLTRQLRHLATR